MNYSSHYNMVYFFSQKRTNKNEHGIVTQGNSGPPSA